MFRPCGRGYRDPLERLEVCCFPGFQGTAERVCVHVPLVLPDHLDDFRAFSRPRVVWKYIRSGTLPSEDIFSWIEARRRQQSVAHLVLYVARLVKPVVRPLVLHDRQVDVMDAEVIETVTPDMAEVEDLDSPV